jgi:hypothetical protein
MPHTETLFNTGNNNSVQFFNNDNDDNFNFNSLFLCATSTVKRPITDTAYNKHLRK